MSTCQFTSFGKVSVLDKYEKSILSCISHINCKTTFYTDEEIHQLEKSYQKIVFSNIMTEFELILNMTHNIKPKVVAGEVYTFNIFDSKRGLSSYFEGLIIKQERTHKVDEKQTLYFYSGVRISKKGYDALKIFGFYDPKIFILRNKKDQKLAISKCYSQEKEAELRAISNSQDFEMYAISDFLEANSVLLNDGAIHALATN